MNKRGILVVEIGFWLMRIVMVMVIMMGVALAVRTYVNAKVDMNAAEPALLVQVLGTSPAFLARDSTGALERAISVERFKQSQQTLAETFSYGTQRHAAAMLTLFDRDGKPISSVQLNPDYYQELAAQLGPLGGKTVIQQVRQWPVVLVEKGSERPGILRVEVLQPI
jgi:hypothetical protein